MLKSWARKRRLLHMPPHTCNLAVWATVAGSFLIADLPEMSASDDGAKVRGEVVAVLYEAHIKELRRLGAWCEARCPAWAARRCFWLTS